MIVEINRYNRWAYSAQIDAMHEDRKVIFVDMMRWQIPVYANQYEIDQFDTRETVYLMCINEESGEHLGSVRLLETQKPHLMSEVFPELCTEGIPRGPDIYEVSRLMTASALETAVQRKVVRDRLALGMVEWALRRNVRAFSAVVGPAMLQQIVGMPWRHRLLGLPTHDAKGLVYPIKIEIGPDTLVLMREQVGIFTPTLHPSEVPTPVAA